MPSRPPVVVQPSRRAVSVVTWYARRSISKKFHALRLLDESPLRTIPAHEPVVFCMAHPSWWDPLIGLVMAGHCLPGRSNFAPIDQRALEHYRFMAKIGFFGIEPGGQRGGVRFLRVADEILRHPKATLWITAQGHFTDPRRRPVKLMPGLAHLARRMERGVIVPLAVEYPFWTEPRPEALVHAGPLIRVSEHPGLDVAQWNALLERRMEKAMDDLAFAAMAREPGRFVTVVKGRSGVQPVYDAWRKLRSLFTGKSQPTEHGEITR